jgi:hypothetical protein
MAVILSTIIVNVPGFRPMVISPSFKDAVRMSEDIKQIMHVLGHKATLDTNMGVYVDGERVVTSMSSVENIRGISSQAIVADVHPHASFVPMMRTVIIPSIRIGVPVAFMGDAAQDTSRQNEGVQDERDAVEQSVAKIIRGIRNI